MVVAWLCLTNPAAARLMLHALWVSPLQAAGSPLAGAVPASMAPTLRRHRTTRAHWPRPSAVEAVARVAAVRVRQSAARKVAQSVVEPRQSPASRGVLRPGRTRGQQERRWRAVGDARPGYLHDRLPHRPRLMRRRPQLRSQLMAPPPPPWLALRSRVDQQQRQHNSTLRPARLQ